MSRGLGRQQVEILEFLEGKGAMPLPSLAVELAKEQDLLDDDGDLSDAIYGNIHRAVRGLQRRGNVDVQKVHLTSVDQLVRWYPTCTMSQADRSLREAFLPYLPAFLKRKGIHPKFSPVVCEKRAFLRLDEVARAQVQAAWPAACRVVERALSRLEGKERDLALGVIVRGEEIILRSTLSAPVALIPSMARLLQVEQMQRSPGAVTLRRFFDLLPRREYQRSRFKGVVYTIADMPERARASIKEPFKEFLLEVAGADVRALPGHADPPLPVPKPKVPAGQALTFGQKLQLLHEQRWPELEPKVTFSPALDLLLRRDVFKEFAFVKKVAPQYVERTRSGRT